MAMAQLIAHKTFDGDRYKPASELDDLYELALAVLPPFSRCAKQMIDGAAKSPPSAPDRDATAFLEKFYSTTFTIHNILLFFDPNHPAVDQERTARNLMLILDELESRFLSRGRLLALFSSNVTDDETYPKLRAFRRSFVEDDPLHDQNVDPLMRNARIASSSAKKRSKLLASLNESLTFFGLALANADEGDTPCPLRFEEYPSRQVVRFASVLHSVLRERWCCGNRFGCRVAAHTSRRMQLSLTAYRCFETAPVRDQNARAGDGYKFQVLFPKQAAIQWQDSEIRVKEIGVVKIEHEEVGPDLCRALSNPVDKTRLVLLACKQNRKLWWLRADYNIPFHKRMEGGRFVPLGSLLRQKEQGCQSKFAFVEERDRLILSFILASSLLQLYPNFWFEPWLSSHKVHFLASTASEGVDVKNPFLVLDEGQGDAHLSSTPLCNPHRYPGLLGLGIILLEIASAALICFEVGTDKCIRALELFDELLEEWQLTGSRTVSDGLIRAIKACIDPSRLKNRGLDRDSVNDRQIRRYIFEEVVVPLGELITVAYELPLREIGRPGQEPEDVGPAHQHNDHLEEEIPSNNERRLCTERWFRKLNNVHSVLDDLQDQLEDLPHGVLQGSRIKIAVLDTGFQPSKAVGDNFAEQGRIRATESQSFVSGTEPKELAQSGWRIDQDGHGTDVATIVLKVCPLADVHVAQVFRSRKDLQDPKMNAQTCKSIAEAIREATETWNVDIIVMSFGFTKAIPMIRQAIEDASRKAKPPLIFAAGRNDGANMNMAWPARADEVFGINSTDGNGAPSSFNPSPEEYSRIFHALGEAVPVKDPGANSRPVKYFSGTSCATPIAAGLAANLLVSARMAVAALPPEKRERFASLPDELQARSGMTAVLKKLMSRKHECGVASLLPWEFLSRDRLDQNRFLQDIEEVLENL
ncbi:hypothetical protein OQA88_4635 [Cercophora sp. LCS_1]